MTTDSPTTLRDIAPLLKRPWRAVDMFHDEMSIIWTEDHSLVAGIQGPVRREISCAIVVEANGEGAPQQEIATLKAAHAARVTELLEANNRDVERRRAAETRAFALQARLTTIIGGISPLAHDFCPRGALLSPEAWSAVVRRKGEPT